MTDTAQTLNDLYVGCMNCTNGPSLCPGVWKDIPGGVPPRGFYFKVVPVKLLIVAKNPGHPLVGETALLRGHRGSQLFHTYRKFQETLYPDPDRFREPSTRFHKTLFRYISDILEIPISDVYLHAAHTNLVKCSTHDDQARLNPTTIAQCYAQYFRAELALLQPKVLLALGREVERFLLEKKPDHGLPVFYIKHPSYRYRRDVEAEVLGDLRRGIRSYL